VPAVLDRPDPSVVAAAVSESLEYYFELYPSSARDVGRHDFDGVFPDVFRPSTDELDSLMGRLSSLGPIPDPELRADLDMAYGWLERERFRVAGLQRRHRGPLECLAEADVWVYLKEPYDAAAEQVAALEAHLAGLPQFLQRARETLETRLAAGERLHSIEVARALAADLRDVVGLLALEHPDLEATHLAGPAEIAAAACEEFGRAVEKTTPTAAVYGPELLGEYLRATEGVEHPVGDLLEEAQAEVDALVSALDSLAATLGVERRQGFYELMAEATSGATALDSIQELVEQLRDFWTQKDVVSVETVNPLECRRRPRLLTAAQFGLAGSTEEGVHPHFLYLPERPDSVENVQPSRRRQFFSRPMLEVLAVHETFAGHYVHAEAAFRRTRGIRTALRLWPGFVEGWAHYAEELAIEQGLAEDRPLVEAAQLLSALEAATRLLVYLSVHTGRWTFSEAAGYAAALCDWSPATAAREVLGATSDPRTVMYTLGKLRIREWRRAAAVGTSAGELKGFHDRLLQCGFASLATVWQYYLDGQREAALAVTDD
jgi:Bacterial protein of unknown function (DUF885)